MGNSGSAIRRFNASGDGRLIGMLIPGSFQDYSDFYPHDGRRGYVTAPELPLQILAATGSPGVVGAKHLHRPLDQPVRWPTRHSIWICISGRLRIDLCETDGTPVGTIEVGPGDALLSTEGHQVSYLEPGTRSLEIKQGPYPGTEDADRELL